MTRWFFLIILLPCVSFGAGLKPDPSVTPESRDEGDSPLFINVACPSLSPDGWQTVASSDTIRRVLFLTTDYASAPPPICLGTAVALGLTPVCNTSFKGLILNSN